MKGEDMGSKGRETRKKGVENIEEERRMKGRSRENRRAAGGRGEQRKRKRER